MRFIYGLPTDVITTMLDACGMMWMISKPTGEILDSSPEFRRWIGYTQEELSKKTWMSLKPPDDRLQANLQSLHDLNSWSPFFVIRTQYVPNGERPQWGKLNVCRHPANGDAIDFCWCWWTPLETDTETALEQSQKDATARLMIVDAMRLQMESLTSEIRKLTTMDEDETWLMSSFRMVKKHPRIALMILSIMGGVLGINQILDLGQKAGVVPIPVHVESMK